jgi:hypothetical protein
MSLQLAKGSFESVSNVERQTFPYGRTRLFSRLLELRHQFPAARIPEKFHYNTIAY